VQQCSKYSPGTTLSLVCNIRKDRLSTFVPRYFIWLAAAVQLGILVPPLHSLRPSLSGALCKMVVCSARCFSMQGMWIEEEGPKYGPLPTRSLASCCLRLAWYCSPSVATPKLIASTPSIFKCIGFPSYVMGWKPPFSLVSGNPHEGLLQKGPMYHPVPACVWGFMAVGSVRC